MDRYIKSDNTDKNDNIEADYYMHNNEQLKPLKVRELIKQELFDDVDSLFSMGGRISFLC